MRRRIQCTFERERFQLPDCPLDWSTLGLASLEIFSNFPGPSHWKEYPYEFRLFNMAMKEHNCVPLLCHCKSLFCLRLCSICLLSLLCLMYLWLLQGEPGKWEDAGIKMTTLGTYMKGPRRSFLCCPGCFSKMVVVLVVWWWSKLLVTHHLLGPQHCLKHLLHLLHEVLALSSLSMWQAGAQRTHWLKVSGSEMTCSSEMT